MSDSNRQSNSFPGFDAKGIADRLSLSIHQQEGYQFMAAAFEVYNDRGYGLAEEIYQECLEIELEIRHIPFLPKADLKCFYKGRELKKHYVPDLFVYGCLVVELKAVGTLLPEHEAQLFNYLRIARQPVGYLVNFGHRDALEWKRFILSEFIETTTKSEPLIHAHRR
jgi:GxxExxY protein